ncbi:MAG TPA: polysaccharide deacetylase family protein [Frankiaceae bacterium]|nr:polysaccharide deacetylase family protein [Frankiaceae bacterium]
MALTGRAALLPLTLAAAAAAAHTATLVTSVPQLRPLWPGVAGIGKPGHVALTFDDGPDEASTPLFLDLLARLDVRATFFLLGEMVTRFPDLPRRMAAEGHELAVHSWDHRSHLLRAPGRHTIDQLERTADLIESVADVRPTRFRPPYGMLTGGGVLAAQRVGLRPLLWTSWGKDWSETATPESVLQCVSRGRLDGGTVLLHDSDCTSAPGAWRSAYGALPRLVDTWAENGLRVGPVREHALPL